MTKLYHCYCPNCGKPIFFTKNDWFFDETKSKEALMYCRYCNFLMFVPKRF